MKRVFKKKVVVYVIRENKLLVFRHKDFSYEEVGIQVPAGTIEKDELPEDAALRELIEETNKSCFKIVSSLGVASYDMNPYRDEVQERHFFLATTTDSLPDRWESREGDIKFECFWIPLGSGHVLQSGQGFMLGKATELL